MLQLSVGIYNKREMLNIPYLNAHISLLKLANSCFRQKRKRYGGEGSCNCKSSLYIIKNIITFIVFHTINTHMSLYISIHMFHYIFFMFTKNWNASDYSESHPKQSNNLKRGSRVIKCNIEEELIKYIKFYVFQRKNSSQERKS